MIFDDSEKKPLTTYTFCHCEERIVPLDGTHRDVIGGVHARDVCVRPYTPPGVEQTGNVVMAFCLGVCVALAFVAALVGGGALEIAR